MPIKYVSYLPFTEIFFVTKSGLIDYLPLTQQKQIGLPRFKSKSFIWTVLMISYLANKIIKTCIVRQNVIPI